MGLCFCTFSDLGVCSFHVSFFNIFIAFFLSGFLSRLLLVSFSCFRVSFPSILSFSGVSCFQSDLQGAVPPKKNCLQHYFNMVFDQLTFCARNASKSVQNPSKYLSMICIGTLLICIVCFHLLSSSRSTRANGYNRCCFGHQLGFFAVCTSKNENGGGLTEALNLCANWI